DAPKIREVAKKLINKLDVETVNSVMAYVVKTVQSGPFDVADHGALWALEKKKGDCTEYTDLFVALCRACNLPARPCDGYVMVSGDTPKHAWAEVYFENFGWVPFDPAFVYHKRATAHRLSPIYIYVDRQRNNKLLDGGHFFYWRWYGEAVQVK